MQPTAAICSLPRIKRPNTFEYARVYVFWTNGRSVLESKPVRATQVIDHSDSAYKPDTVLETKERRIHHRWRGCEMIGRIVIARRRDDDHLRRSAPLKAWVALLWPHIVRITPTARTGSRRRRPKDVRIGTARRDWTRGKGPRRQSYDRGKDKNKNAEQSSPGDTHRVREAHNLIVTELQPISAPHRKLQSRTRDVLQSDLKQHTSCGISSPLASCQRFFGSFWFVVRGRCPIVSLPRLTAKFLSS